MFHPISPCLSGTDGKVTVPENAARLPAQKRETSNAENSDRRECVVLAPSVRRSWGARHRVLLRPQRNQAKVQQVQLFPLNPSVPWPKTLVIRRRRVGSQFAACPSSLQVSHCIGHGVACVIIRIVFALRA